MPLIPKCMSTQHPDNAFAPPYATDGVLKGEGEIAEAVDIFSLGSDEQMWDSEGKEADNQVVQKLLTNHSSFFHEERKLGTDCVLTLRVPNPRIELEMRKSTVEALQGIPKAWDMAREFYGDGLQEPPIQEVILPFTTSAEELSALDIYYRKFVVGQESQQLIGERTVKDWIGEFFPKRIRIIPLIEDLDHITHSDDIVRTFLQDAEADYQRVFLARSDPALNYGAVAAELMLKIGLWRLDRLQAELGVPLYPIIGVGAVPFRGHLSPTNVERAFREYPSAHTFTVQSSFKFDHDRELVRDGIAKIVAHNRSEAPPIDEERALAIISKVSALYQSQVRSLAHIIGDVATKVPKRRERKLHVGLFGYGRSLEGSGGEVTLPRAIGFAASMYSVGVPPELLGLAALNADDMAFVREVYPSFDEDMAVALRYVNERRVRELLGDEHANIATDLGQDIDRVHEGLTSAIWAGLDQNTTGNVPHYIEEAAQIRRFLG